MIKDDNYFMAQAIKQAKQAMCHDEVPIGCVIVKDDTIIAKAYNQREMKQKATAHAEITAIERANKKIHSWRLEDCTLYVTLEPCPMCAGAILLSRVKRVVYGARDPKGGAVVSCLHMYEVQGWNHYPMVSGGIMEKECAALLQQFFKAKREQKKAQKMMHLTDE